VICAFHAAKSHSFRTPRLSFKRSPGRLAAKAGLYPLERFHDLTIRKPRPLHLVELLNEKILLLNAPLLRGDYPIAPSNINEKRADIYCDRGGLSRGTKKSPSGRARPSWRSCAAAI